MVRSIWIFRKWSFKKKRKKKKEKGSVNGVVGVVLNVKITSFQKLSQPSYLRQCKGQIEFHFNKQKINVFFFQWWFWMVHGEANVDNK